MFLLYGATLTQLTRCVLSKDGHFLVTICLPCAGFFMGDSPLYSAEQDKPEKKKARTQRAPEFI